MALECNIDAAGKAARLRGGIASLAGGLLLAGGLATGLIDGTFWWLSTAGAVFGGAFRNLRGSCGLVRGPSNGHPNPIVSLLPATLRFPPQRRGTPTLLRPKEEAPEWEPRDLAKQNQLVTSCEHLRADQGEQSGTC
jgi:hypothetical protein